MRSSLTIIALIAQCLIVPSIAWACGCAGVEGESFEASVLRGHSEAERVFVGRVIWSDEETVTFAIEAVWKGDTASEVALKHGEIRGHVVVVSTCDYRFPKVGRFLVFAERDGATLRAGSCGHTGPFEGAQRAMAVLDAAEQRRSPDGTVR